MREYTIDLLTRMGEEGTGKFIETGIIILAVLAVLMVLYVLLSSLLRARDKGQSAAMSPGVPVVGRLEKLEMTLNDFKTESTRAQEFCSVEFKWIRNELNTLKQLIEKTSSGAGGAGGLGYTPPATPDPDGDDWDFSDRSPERDSVRAERELSSEPEPAVAIRGRDAQDPEKGEAEGSDAPFFFEGQSN